MNVPLLDLKAQYRSMGNALEPVIKDIIESQYFINGPAVKECEVAIAEYSQAKYAIGVSSGTDALLASLMSLGIGRNPVDNNPAPEVITTAYSFFATPGSIWRAGAVPVFVDIDEDTFNIDTSKIEAAITERTVAIMPVHLYGQIAQMKPIMEIAKKYALKVIEDCAQAIGASQDGKKAGCFGDVGCFSFFPSKNLGGFGDGGIITTNNQKLAERMLECRNHGAKPKYYHKWVGGNFRLDTIQAAVIIEKLKYLDSWHHDRRQNASYYNEKFANVSEVKTPKIESNNQSIFNQYVICVPRRDELLTYLREKSIGCEIYYPVALHLQDCFKELGYKKGEMPVAEKAAEASLALPIYPELTIQQQDAVIATIKDFYIKG